MAGGLWPPRSLSQKVFAQADGRLPVQRFVFAWFAEEGQKMGFKNVACGPLVRSSCHADQQAHGDKIG